MESKTEGVKEEGVTALKGSEGVEGCLRKGVTAWERGLKGEGKREVKARLEPLISSLEY